MPREDLSERNKERIHAEESYRALVRQQFEASKPPIGSWKRLNSPFAIWILSSVFLGLVSFTYSCVDENRSQRRNPFSDETDGDCD